MHRLALTDLFFFSVQYLTHHLLSNYGKKNKITSFLQDVEFIIVPIMNIDGYDHTWYEFIFRKPYCRWREIPTTLKLTEGCRVNVISATKITIHRTNNRLWRKNRRQLNLGAYGVDLNR